jgi:GDP-L-fucose synthase
MISKNSKIYVAGHNGLVGSAICRSLTSQGYTNLHVANHKDLDLMDPYGVESFFRAAQPDYVFLAAAKVGGIHANNTYPAEFIYNNLQIQTNVIQSAHRNKTKKLMFLGSVCIYPKYAEVPVKESSLLTGMLEPTNEPYAVAKIAGITMCKSYRRQYGDDFISVMPCNLYGEGDNFHPQNSHVIPALIRKFVEAKQKKDPTVTCWGTGNARREFMFADDMADALVFLMKKYSDDEIINIGSGVDFTIRELAETVKKVVGYEGEIIWDTTKPDGTPKRLLDSTKLFNLGWKPKLSLEEGLTKTVNWYIKQESK